MLQLIGWLGCVYLVVKVLGFAADRNLRKEDGSVKEEALAAIVIGWLSAIGFAFAFLAQGSAASANGALADFGESSDSLEAQTECLDAATSAKAIMDCYK